MNKQAKSLPVVMHHYVSRYRGLSMSPELFEENCRTMAEHGWRGVGLSEAEGFLLGQEPLPEKSFLFTFDDGYLDNYIYAWPILQKYGHKAVIFAVGNCIDEASKTQEVGVLRPTIADVWSGKITEDDLPDIHHPAYKDSLGYNQRKDTFFTWEEARLMESSGIISVGAHSLSHSGVYTSSEYSGFRKPDDDNRPLPREYVQGAFWGCPIFTTGAELTSRAFTPNKELEQAIKKLVPQNYCAANAFFQSAKQVQKLEELVASFQGALGKLENEEEQWSRICKVMEENQKLLRRELGHPVKSFCWPWGDESPLAIKAGQEAGFEVFYKVHRGVNISGNNLRVNRFRAERKPGKWLLSRSRIYSRPLLGKIYCSIRI